MIGKLDRWVLGANGSLDVSYLPKIPLGMETDAFRTLDFFATEGSALLTTGLLLSHHHLGRFERSRRYNT